MTDNTRDAAVEPERFASLVFSMIEANLQDGLSRKLVHRAVQVVVEQCGYRIAPPGSVVLDPESDEDVLRLTDAWDETMTKDLYSTEPSFAQALLRRLAGGTDD